jgi:hypothetical protein
MPIRTTPLVNPLDTASQPRFHRLALYRPVALSSFTPIVRKAKQVKRLRLAVTISVTIRFLLSATVIVVRCPEIKVTIQPVVAFFLLLPCIEIYGTTLVDGTDSASRHWCPAEKWIH